MAAVETDGGVVADEGPGGGGNTSESAPAVAGALPAPPMSGVVAWGWMLSSGAAVAGRLAGFAAQLVLAALLSKDDFGVAGIAMAIATIGALVQHAGLGQVLVARQDRRPEGLRAAAGLSLAIGLAGAALLLAAGPLGARIYHEPRLTPLLAIIAASTALSALSAVPAARLQMDLQFKAVAGLATAEAVVSAGLTVAAAVCGMGVYAFVVPGLFVSSARLAVVWRLARMEPRFALDLGEWRAIATSSGWLFVASVAFTLVNQGDYLLVGLFCDKAAVGTYYLAFALSMQFVLLVSSSGASVMLPALARMDDPGRRVRAFVRAARVMGITLVPLCIAQAVLARPAVELLFRNKWLAAVPLVQVFSVGMVMRLASWPAGAYVISQRRFFTRAMQALIAAPVFLSAVAVGAATGGTMGAAIAEIAYFATVEVAFTYWNIRPDGGTARDLWRIYGPPIVTAAVAAAVGLAPLLLVTSRLAVGREVLRLMVAAVATLAFLAVYAGLVRWWHPDVWAEGREHAGGIVGRIVRRWRGGSASGGGGGTPLTGEGGI